MKLTLLQNCLSDLQLAQTMPGFEPLDFRHNPRPEWREFQIFEEVVEQGLHLQSDILGAVSSRFQAKSLLDGHRVRAWIQSTPGRDVYVVNPWPQLSYSNFNCNSRPGIIHRQPDIVARFQKVLDRARVPLNFHTVGRQHNGHYGLCSYWFGSARFWSALMEELVWPVIRLSRQELGSELHDFLYQPMPYYGIAAHRPGGLPFLLERATSLFIQTRFASSAAFLPRSREEVLECCVFPFERDIVRQFGDQVDAWDAAGTYDSHAMAYFAAATEHTNTGWNIYCDAYPVSFDHGNPRPTLPWFKTAQHSAKTEVLSLLTA